jgi:GNAT superfamily N-acetyltransferase
MISELRVDERPLSRRDKKRAALVASRAFFDDPFFCYLAPKESMRSRGLTLFFLNALRHMGKGGKIVTVRNGDNIIVGVSAWLPAGAYPQSIPTQLAQIPGTIRALYRRPRALLEGSAYLNEMMKKHPKEINLYLYLLVADPSIQRRGVGTMLLNHGLAWANEEGIGSYLETQKEDNIAYYGRFGYHLRDTLSPVTDGPPIFTMWRDAP